MKTVRVRKYGGTSVGSSDRIAAIARGLVTVRQDGVSQVVVVSAMGSLTDDLRRMAAELSDTPSRRELDMLLSSGEQVSIALLAMAIQSCGGQAVSLTAAQCGIVTDNRFSRARIQDIRTERIWRELEANHIIVVAGFQGVTEGHDITTLGRGGSDITAVALAAALGAQECEIYTDVAGVYSADPRVVPEARVLETVGYPEMLEYAASGSKVLHPRAVEIARVFGVPVRVCSSLEPGPGTLICKRGDMEKVAITGVTSDSDIARVTLTKVFDKPGIAATVSRTLAEADINVRLFIQSMGHGGANDVCVIIDEADVDEVRERLQDIMTAVGAEAVEGRTPRGQGFDHWLRNREHSVGCGPPFPGISG